MSEPNDLSQKLAALSDVGSRFGARGRIISDNGVPTPVQAILTEVSETALAQDLTFHIGDAGSIVLVVSGRRILAVRSVDGLVMPAVAEQLSGKPLGTGSDATQRALMALLMQIDLMQDVVETSSADGAPFSAPPGAGLSPERVAALAGVVFPFTMPTQMEQLLMQLGGCAVASLVVEGDAAPSSSGDPAEIERLNSVAATLGILDRSKPMPSKLSIFGQQSGPAPFIGAAVSQSSGAVWSMEPQHIGQTVSAFHKIFPE